MQQFSLGLPETLSPDEMAATIDHCLAGAGLTVTMRDTLRGYPGCTHWHVKRGRERGVLEVTLWPAGRRLWLSVHQNRNAPWIDAALPALRDELVTALMLK
jgi:hypothetical protein